MFRAGRKVPHCQKWIATRYRFSLWTGPFRGCFQFLFNSRRDQKRTLQIHALERVAILFFRLRHDARNAPSCFKSSPENMKPQKAGRMTHIHVLNWGGPPLGVQILYTFPTQKWASNKSNSSCDIILRMLRFLAESSGVTKLELFQPFPIVNRVQQVYRLRPTPARLRS